MSLLLAVLSTPVTVTGTIAVTADNATSGFTGSVGVSGTIAVTAANATGAFTGTVGVSGTIANTAANATSAFTGTFTAAIPAPTGGRPRWSTPIHHKPRPPVVGVMSCRLDDATGSFAGLFDNWPNVDDEELLLVLT